MVVSTKTNSPGLPSERNLPESRGFNQRIIFQMISKDRDEGDMLLLLKPQYLPRSIWIFDQLIALLVIHLNQIRDTNFPQVCIKGQGAFSNDCLHQIPGKSRERTTWEYSR